MLLQGFDRELALICASMPCTAAASDCTVVTIGRSIEVVAARMA